MLRSLIGLALTVPLTLGGCATRPVVDATPGSLMIDSTARALMRREQVQGLALAVINNGEVAHVAAYGIRNAAGDPLTPETIMYGASLTKTVFAYLVMQLVDEGQLNLDASIATLLPRPLPEYFRDLAGAQRGAGAVDEHRAHVGVAALRDRAEST